MLVSIRRLLFSVTIICSVAVCALSQSEGRRSKIGEPSDGPRRVSAEPKDPFKKWVNEDVIYVITPAERAAFLALKTNEERENFIKWFWDRRDPDHDTEENEFRDQYYERIAYANEHFASGIPGWKTDRGRIYITWGKPDSVEAHSSGGSYERPSYEGGGSAMTYPFETWFYRHLDNVGDGVEIEFVDQTGSGEYRMSGNPDDKIAGTKVVGVGQGNGRSVDGASYQREQDSLFSRLLKIKDLSTPPAVKFDDPTRLITDSPIIDNNALPFDLRIDYFRQTDDRVITAFTIQTHNKELQFKNEGGLQTARMNIFAKITAVSGKRSGIFEDSVVTNASAEELAEARDRKSVYQKGLALAPGIYRADVIVRDVVTGNKGLVSMGFTVPKYDQAKLSTSSLILASTLRTATERDIGERFVIGGTKVIPNLVSEYKIGEDVGVYLQVYNADVDQTTLRPAIDVNYIVLKDGKVVLTKTEDWAGSSDSGSRLTLARLLPTSNLPAGEYELRIEIRDSVKLQSVERSGKFTIAP